MATRVAVCAGFAAFAAVAVLLLASSASADDAGGAALVVGPSDAVAAAPAEADGAAAAPLTAETMATMEAPKGFRYSLLRSALVDDLSGTYLYLRADKKATSTRSVPVPKDRAVLAECVSGGDVDDLVRGATVSVRFDPAGRYRPEITVEQKVEVEVLSGAKVLDRGGNKLYIVTAEGKARGFEIEGDAKAWDGVVEGGDASQLLAGAVVDVRFDPSGREPLSVKIVTPPGGAKADSGGADGGCGCAARGHHRLPSGGALALAVAAIALLLRRRERGLTAP